MAQPQMPQLDQEQPEFEERVVAIDRVARVVKGGRRFRFRALVVVGNARGKLGLGIAKGSDVTTSITKATSYAKKKLVDVPLYDDRTIGHEVWAKFSGAKIMLKPAAPGTGVIAGGAIRDILEVAGVKDVLSKSFGSSNKLNCAYAALTALTSLRADIQADAKPQPKAKQPASEAAS
jgi:small subunit ribosomal protein S5